jgi:hypothetical protein
LVFVALEVKLLQNGLRKQADDIIKVSAFGNYEKAAYCADRNRNEKC